MVKKIKIAITFLVGFSIVFFLICIPKSEKLKRNNFIQKNGYSPGFVLTFDDAYISEWYKIKEILNKFNIKATFFVSGFENISNEEIKMLSNLADEGHEIASHSLNHIDAHQFIQNRSVQSYLNKEILPELKAMRSNMFTVTSFSYPYGGNDKTTDLELLRHFSLLRDVTDFQRHFYSMFCTAIDEIDEIYFGHDRTKVISALGIDENFNISIEEIKLAFYRAKTNHEIIVLYAHQPVEKIYNTYQISYKYLESILNATNEIGLVSYRFRDLSSMLEPK